MTIKRKGSPYKFRITKQPSESYGLTYNVQVFHSFDGGKNYWYCGIGRFCASLREVFDYIKRRTGGTYG